MIKTKLTTKTKIAIGVALAAGALALASAFVPRIQRSKPFTVVLNAPKAGQTLIGKIGFQASTSDRASYIGFDIFENGAFVASYPAKLNNSGKQGTYLWDSTMVKNGRYAVEAKAESAGPGRPQVKAAPVEFNVNNPAPQQPATSTPPTGSACGNGQCESGETTASCAADCPASPSTVYKPDGSTTPPTSPRTSAVVSLNALPTTSLTSGTAVVMRFTVTAGTVDNVSLKKLSFKVRSMTSGTSTTMVVSSPGLREVGQATNLAATADVGTSGSDCGFAASAGERCVRIALSGEQVITAGTSKTFDLRVSVSGAILSGDILEASLLGDGTAGIGALSGSGAGLGIGGIQRNFIWSDNAAIPHSETSVDWWNGSRAIGLPTGSHMLVRN